MTYEVFNETLKQAKLTKKEFAKQTGSNYKSVLMWGKGGKVVPAWVQSWLHVHVKARLYDEIVARVQKKFPPLKGF